MDENTQENQQSTVESTRQFNDHQEQTRSRVEATIKSVFLISGGMLMLSVGAVLSDTPANIPAEVLPTLKWGWGLLFYSIAAALFLMLLMVISTFHIGVQWGKRLVGKVERTELINTWIPLRIAEWVVGVSSVLACLFGLAFMAIVAVSVIEQSPVK